MPRTFTNTLMLTVGMILGWWLHGQVNPGPELPGASVDVETVAIPAYAPRYEDRTPSPAAANRRTEDQSTQAAPSRQGFRSVLEQQDPNAAMAYYEWALGVDGRYAAVLRPELLAYLERCMQQCTEGAFEALVNEWLSSYYEDISVLVLLAEYQRRQGHPEEAARSLQFAKTYAYQPSQREYVWAALIKLVKATDAQFSEQQDWIALLGFYELLEAIDLTRPELRLRQAALYQAQGEPGRAQALLQALLDEDNGGDPRWTAAIDSQLAAIAPQIDSTPETPAVPAQAIAVTRRGDHYLVDSTLNERESVVLMIDTGASITTLSEDSFNRLGGAGFDRLGTRLFNTANGVARGTVYRADSIRLGDAQLSNIEIAVLDYPTGNVVDGLLGMNVLRNYRFQIDQDRALLYLRPR
jgi:clan AA aspartic protease (TIGR02281 family)